MDTRLKRMGINLLVMIVFMGFFYNMRLNDAKGLAKNFLTVYYTVDDTSDYPYTDLTKLEQTLKQKYGELLTQPALQALTTTRVILENEEAALQAGATISFKDVSFKMIKTNHFSFVATLIAKYTDGTMKAITQSGDLTVVQLDGKWVVDSFNPTKGDLLKAVTTK